jgi:hypothetical protein
MDHTVTITVLRFWCIRLKEYNSNQLEMIACRRLSVWTPPAQASAAITL